MTAALLDRPKPETQAAPGGGGPLPPTGNPAGLLTGGYDHECPRGERDCPSFPDLGQPRPIRCELCGQDRTQR